MTLSSSTLHTAAACARFGKRIVNQHLERVSLRTSAFAALRAGDESETEAADQKGYMTAFS